MEKNHDPLKGDRYLLEQEIEDIKTSKSYRLSEYVYKQKGQTSLCAPHAYTWSRNATVNIVLTVGGLQGRWVQHFINNLAEIYRQTKDQNLNVIIMDFHSKDINIEEALKLSGLPRYILLHMKSKFHKTIGLQYAMNIVTDPNDIVFVCDLHLYLPVTIVDHIRKVCTVSLFYCRFQVTFQHAIPKFIANLQITFPSSKIGRKLRIEMNLRTLLRSSRPTSELGNVIGKFATNLGTAMHVEK